MGDAGFPPGRDGPAAAGGPISKSMESAVDAPPADTRSRNLHLLRDCLALGNPERRRPPAKLRLEEALGPELTRRLLRSLSAGRR
jgi:hypothetical protein